MTKPQTKLAMKENQVALLEEKIAAMQKEVSLLKEDISILKGQVKEREFAPLMLDAIICGVLPLRYGMTAPYTHGYEIRNMNAFGIKASVPLFNQKDSWYAPSTLVAFWDKCAKIVQTELGLSETEFAKKLSRAVNKAWKNLPVSYNPTLYSISGRQTYGRPDHIANGYETDGFYHIVKGGCQGDYSSYTPSRQNDLARELILMKGYCLDLFDTYAPGLVGTDVDRFRKITEGALKRHGLDSDLSDSYAWGERNPLRASPEHFCRKHLS